MFESAYDQNSISSNRHRKNFVFGPNSGINTNTELMSVTTLKFTQ